MDENLSRGEQAAEEVARRWMAAMQSMGDQLLRQQQAHQQMSRQWMEQAQTQQQAFQQVVQQSLGAYADLFKPPSR